ncbi:hypothetical protein R3P38DRAFT_2779036 [Favolaschia claudopus]|uniref:Chromatin elongation factor SPT5 n=1 Tax=Favolaschia claudopus TaxID=2862362 RepID=A0AAW0BG41_9AGAR
MSSSGSASRLLLARPNSRKDVSSQLHSEIPDHPFPVHVPSRCLDNDFGPSYVVVPIEGSERGVVSAARVVEQPPTEKKGSTSPSPIIMACWFGSRRLKLLLGCTLREKGGPVPYHPPSVPSADALRTPPPNPFQAMVQNYGDDSEDEEAGSEADEDLHLRTPLHGKLRDLPQALSLIARDISSNIHEIAYREVRPIAMARNSESLSVMFATTTDALYALGVLDRYLDPLATVRFESPHSFAESFNAGERWKDPDLDWSPLESAVAVSAEEASFCTTEPETSAAIPPPLIVGEGHAPSVPIAWPEDSAEQSGVHEASESAIDDLSQNPASSSVSPPWILTPIPPPHDAISYDQSPGRDEAQLRRRITRSSDVARKRTLASEETTDPPRVKRVKLVVPQRRQLQCITLLINMGAKGVTDLLWRRFCEKRRLVSVPSTGGTGSSTPQGILKNMLLALKMWRLLTSKRNISNIRDIPGTINTDARVLRATCVGRGDSIFGSVQGSGSDMRWSARGAASITVLDIRVDDFEPDMFESANNPRKRVRLPASMAGLYVPGSGVKVKAVPYFYRLCKSAKRRRVSSVADFLDLAAEEDRAEEDEDYEDEDDPSDDEDTGAPETLPPRLTASAPPQEDAEELARKIKERYSRRRRSECGAVPQAGEDEGSSRSIFRWMHTLEHTTDTTKTPIWTIKVTRGREWDVVCTIFKIAACFPADGKVLSVSASPASPGHVYIECVSQVIVGNLLRRVAFTRRTVLPRSITALDLKSVLVLPAPTMKLGTWVRVRSNNVYHLDLAWVYDYNPVTSDASIYLVPRWSGKQRRHRSPLRLVAGEILESDVSCKNEPRQSSLGVRQDIKRSRADTRRGTRQALLSEHVDGTLDATCPYELDGSSYRFGFLVRRERFVDLIVHRVQPAEQELALWMQSPLYNFVKKCANLEQVDLEVVNMSDLLTSCCDMQRSLQWNRVALRIGDRVRLPDGDDLGPVGWVTSVTAEHVQVEMYDDAREGTFISASWPTEAVVGDFRIGDYVEVITGRWVGLRAWIVQVEWSRREIQLMNQTYVEEGVRLLDDGQSDIPYADVLGAVGDEGTAGSIASLVRLILPWSFVRVALSETGLSSTGGLSAQKNPAPPAAEGPRRHVAPDPFSHIEVQAFERNIGTFYGMVVGTSADHKKVSIRTEGRAVNTVELISVCDVKERHTGLSLPDYRNASAEQISELRTAQDKSRLIAAAVPEGPEFSPEDLPGAADAWPEAFGGAVHAASQSLAPAASSQSSSEPPSNWLLQSALESSCLDVVVRGASTSSTKPYNDVVGVIRSMPKVKRNDRGSVKVRFGRVICTDKWIPVKNLFPLTTTEFEGVTSRALARPILDVIGVNVVVIGPDTEGRCDFVGRTGITSLHGKIRLQDSRVLVLSPNDFFPPPPPPSPDYCSACIHSVHNDFALEDNEPHSFFSSDGRILRCNGPRDFGEIELGDGSPGLQGVLPAEKPRLIHSPLPVPSSEHTVPPALSNMLVEDVDGNCVHPNALQLSFDGKCFSSAHVAHDSVAPEPSPVGSESKSRSSTSSLFGSEDDMRDGEMLGEARRADLVHKPETRYTACILHRTRVGNADIVSIDPMLPSPAQVQTVPDRFTAELRNRMISAFQFGGVPDYDTFKAILYAPIIVQAVFPAEGSGVSSVLATDNLELRHVEEQEQVHSSNERDFMSDIVLDGDFVANTQVEGGGGTAPRRVPRERRRNLVPQKMERLPVFSVVFVSGVQGLHWSGAFETRPVPPLCPAHQGPPSPLLLATIHASIDPRSCLWSSLAYHVSQGPKAIPPATESRALDGYALRIFTLDTLCCGHETCYVCIRVHFEHKWECPVCRTTVHEPPVSAVSHERAIRVEYGNWDLTRVNFSWVGLEWPVQTST